MSNLNVVPQGVANLCSAVTLALLVACLLGWVSLRCRMGDKAGYASNPINGVFSSSPSFLNAISTSTTNGGGVFGDPAGDGPINELEFSRRKAEGLVARNVSGMVARNQGFAVRGNEPPVFWNAGELLDINPVWEAARGNESNISPGMSTVAGTPISGMLSPY
jgi:hypothetical protein